MTYYKKLFFALTRGGNMGVYTSLKDHFLIAMPTMADPHFSHSVIYICEHSPEGAMGLIINLPLNISLGDVLLNMNIKTDDEDVNHLPVLAGGPVQQERGFVLHRPLADQKWESSLSLTQQISVTTSKDILFAIANHNGPKDLLIVLGYASWEAGQLEKEIAQNTWLCGPADPQVLFDVAPENRWRAAAALLGVDMDHISTEVGHA